MSGIVLSSSVRQNLLSLQSTADLLATTQNRLATGKKVNTALDNPTNFFTARRSIRAPVTSTTCWTASATACRSCRPPTPASPRCRSWSIPPSRWPTRRCRPRSVTPPSRRPPRRSLAQRPTISSPIRTRPTLRSPVLRLRSALRISAPPLTARHPAHYGRHGRQRVRCVAAVEPPQSPSDRCCRHADCQRQDHHFRSGREWPRRFGHRLHAGRQHHAQRFGLRDRYPVGQHEPAPRRQRAASSRCTPVRPPTSP